MTTAPTVLKIGGNELSNPDFVQRLARAVARRVSQAPVVLVHGGGQSISAMLDRLGIQPRFVNGQRVTDEDTLRVVEMILSGEINKLLTDALLSAGVDALGLSGVDRDLIRVEPLDPTLGWVGRVVSVRAEVLAPLFQQQVVPVISPISRGPDGRYNVNADNAAGAVAAALDAESLTFLTNVPGVRANGSIMPLLTPSQVRALIEDGTINGGMIPKTQAALAALGAGVHSAVITDLEGFEIGSGTRVVHHMDGEGLR